MKQTKQKNESPRSFREKVTRYLLQPAGAVNRNTARITALVLFLLGFLLYANTLNHDYALDDDLVYKLNSSVKKGIEGIPEIFRTTNIYGFNQQNFGAYRPFTQMIFALEYQLFGLNPAMQHGLSVLFFALTVMLLFLLMRRMFSSKPLWVPLAISLLFTVHPIHTEVVANIKSSDELISFLLGFVLTFLALFRYLDERKRKWLVLSCLAFMAGLLSKEHIITLLPVIPLTLYFFTPLSWRENLRISLWYILPVLVFLALRAAFIESHSGKVVFLDNFILHLPWYPERLGTILVVMLEYLRLLLYPFPQSCDYGFAHLAPTSLWDPRALLSLVLYAGLAIVAILQFKKRNLLIWCILFLLAGLSIYTHLFAELASTMAERFLFTPSLPFIIGFVLLFYAAVQAPKLQRLREMVYFWPALIIIFAFAMKTIARNTVWKNNDTLFAYDVKFAPNSARLQKSAGDIYINQGIRETDTIKKEASFRTAISYLKTAYAIYPDYPDNLLDLGTAWYHLGRYDSAWVYWKRYAELQPESPRSAENRSFMCIGLYNRGLEALRHGQFEEAGRQYEQALQYDSLYHPAWYQLGLNHATLKAYDLSVQCMKKALAIDSLNSQYWYDYGGILYTAGRYPEAATAWQRTLTLKPDHADAQRGLAALGLRK